MRSGSETASTPISTVTDPHLSMIRRVYPRTPNGCEECLLLGTEWVHLRLCLTCGHVGCCDSSPLRHAPWCWSARPPAARPARRHGSRTTSASRPAYQGPNWPNGPCCRPASSAPSQALQRLARRPGRPGRPRLRPDRPGHGELRAGDEPAGHLRRGRRAQRLGQAGRRGGRRGCDGHQARLRKNPAGIASRRIPGRTGRRGTMTHATWPDGADVLARASRHWLVDGLRQGTGPGLRRRPCR